MKQIVSYIAILVAIAMVVGCSNSDTLDSSSTYKPSDNVISFDESADNWETKSVVYNDASFNQMEIYAYYTAQKKWSESGSSDLDSFMNKQLVEKDETSGIWSYSPLKYWPSDSGDKITFMALVPCEETQMTEGSDGKPLFHYISSPYAEENDDLLVDIKFDEEKNDSGIEFNFKHALTRINLSARLINSCYEDADGQTWDYDGEGTSLSATGEYYVSYTIRDIMFHDIMSDSYLSLLADENNDMEIAWSTPTETISYTATQGHTLKSIDDYKLPHYEGSENLDTHAYTDVCVDDRAIFVLPQSFENAAIAPTIELRINKRYWYYRSDSDTSMPPTEYTDIVYIPDAITLPIPNGGWQDGQWINLQFTYDVGAATASPLTVVSSVYDYTDTDVDVNINRNIYIYSNQNDIIEVESTASTAQMMFFTNYINDLTQPARQVELDGSTTISNGFVFYFAGQDDYIVPKANGTEVDASTGNTIYKYKITADDGYEFTYSVLKQIRGDLGLYTSTESGSLDVGINKDDNDAVYTLTIDIDESHLTPSEDGTYGTFSGTIGVEMLSSAGGMITKKFPITLKKYKE